MEYAVYTRGKQVDYRWSTPPAKAFHNYLAGHGVAVHREVDDVFSVYLFFPSKPADSSHPAEKPDSMGRPIAVGCLFMGCNESQARELVLYALNRWDNCYTDFARFVHWIDGKDERWEVNRAEVDKFAKEITKKAPQSVFPERLENSNTPETRKELSDELVRFNFSKNTGFKLVVDTGILTGSASREISDTADRYFVEKGTRKTLPAPESQITSPPPTQPSPPSSIWLLLSLSLLLLASIGFNGLQWSTGKHNRDIYRNTIAAREATIADHKDTIAKRETEIGALGEKVKELNGKLALQDDIDQLIARKQQLTEQKSALDGELTQLIGKVTQAKQDEQAAKDERGEILAMNKMVSAGLWRELLNKGLTISDVNELIHLKTWIENRIRELQPATAPPPTIVPQTAVQ